eukprot:TRINITY_DN4619_c0_g1_i1.p1 TRINITY_DN4619_c0_g1~~TRINITY_DN4619_c0_g1_i1.p1  ORF type:complete len:420 (+),score=72.72 TRINITY_DN4619_c0_g1_i1:18-1277(+)
MWALQRTQARNTQVHVQIRAITHTSSNHYLRRLSRYNTHTHRNLEGAEKVFSEMKELGIPRSRSHYAVLFSLYYAFLNRERAEFRLETMKVDGISPSAFIYNQVLAIYVRLSDKEAANRLYERMSEEGEAGKPNRVTYSLLLKLYSRVGDVEAAEAMLETIKTKSYAELQDYGMLLSAYTRMLLQEKAQALFKEIRFLARSEGGFRKPGQITGRVFTKGIYCSMIDMYSKLGMIEAAEELFNYLRKEDLLDAVIYSAMVDMYAKQLRTDDIDLMLKELQEKGYFKSDALYSTLIDMNAKIGNISEAEALFQEARQFNRYTAPIFNSMIAMYGREHNIPKMDSIREIAESKGMMSGDLYLPYFLLYVEQKDVAKAMSTWSTILSMNYTPPDTYGQLLIALVKDKSEYYEAAKKLVKSKNE